MKGWQVGLLVGGGIAALGLVAVFAFKPAAPVTAAPLPGGAGSPPVVNGNSTAAIIGASTAAFGAVTSALDDSDLFD